MLECVNVLVLGASKTHDFTNQHIYAIKIQSSNQTIELSIDINCHEYMAITRQFELNSQASKSINNLIVNKINC